MHNLPSGFFKWGTQFIYVGTFALFFIAFSIVYGPFDMQDFLTMDRDLFTFNVSILSAILIGVMISMRVGFHFMGRLKHFTWADYVLWCMGECLILSAFFSLYISLMLRGALPFFTVLFGYGIPYAYLILIYPYVILSLSFAIGAHKQAAQQKAEVDDSLIRFYDFAMKPKFLIAVGAILFIEAEENYVNIYHMDNGKTSKYSLRASMHSIEENCERHGLVRCQRSYFVNPRHVTILRKDKGMVYADLDEPGFSGIPVSKKYYDKLAKLL